MCMFLQSGADQLHRTLGFLYASANEILLLSGMFKLCWKSLIKFSRGWRAFAGSSQCIYSRPGPPSSQHHKKRSTPFCGRENEISSPQLLSCVSCVDFVGNPSSTFCADHGHMLACFSVYLRSLGRPSAQHHQERFGLLGRGRRWRCRSWVLGFIVCGWLCGVGGRLAVQHDHYFCRVLPMVETKRAGELARLAWVCLAPVSLSPSFNWRKVVEWFHLYTRRHFLWIIAYIRLCN